MICTRNLAKHVMLKQKSFATQTIQKQHVLLLVLIVEATMEHIVQEATLSDTWCAMEKHTFNPSIPPGLAQLKQISVTGTDKQP